MNNPRRTFFVHAAAACGALATGHPAWAQAVQGAEMVGDGDAAAMALGYVSDATRADKKKYPTYAAGQRCGTCILFEGNASAASGQCPLFPAKRVAASGWCSSWAKKV